MVDASFAGNKGPARIVHQWQPLPPENKLAVQGGRPVRRAPIPQWPYHSKDEIDAVSAVLASGKVNQWTGGTVTEFERALAAYLGRSFAVAVSNGTVALEIALRSLGLGPGCEIIVPCRSFVATASCVSLVGATPVFADVEFDTQNVSIASIQPLVTPRTKAIVVVHLNGRPCDMPEIMEFAHAKGLYVIEDCAQALGARINGRPIGSFGHAAAFSFCQDKIVSTGGEGGAIAFDDELLRDRAWSYKDHGKSRAAAFATDRKPGFAWMHEGIGTNARMTGVQAAIGLAQLKKLDSWVGVRNAYADRLTASLSKFKSITLPMVPEGHTHARYRLEMTIDPAALAPGWSRTQIMRALNSEGIAAFVGPCPEIYLEGAFAGNGTYPRRPNAMRLGEASLMLLVHPTIDDQYLADCEKAIAKVMSLASS